MLEGSVVLPWHGNLDMEATCEGNPTERIRVVLQNHTDGPSASFARLIHLHPCCYREELCFQRQDDESSEHMIRSLDKAFQNLPVHTQQEQLLDRSDFLSQNWFRKLCVFLHCANTRGDISFSNSIMFLSRLPSR